MATLEPFTQADVLVLQRVIRDAASWRGHFIGLPDPKRLDEFDMHIRHAKQVLAKVREVYRAGKEKV